VVLAKVVLDAGGKITGIDNCICRRIVAAFGHFWWQCSVEAVEAVQIEPVQQEAPPAPVPSPPPPPQMATHLPRKTTRRT
jgi:hypothetical protein